MRIALGPLVAALVLFLFAPVALPAEETATLSGSVLASYGFGLEGVRISILHKEAGETREVVAGERGVYRATEIRAGSSEITAELHGFRSVTRAMEIRPGENTLDLTLEPVTEESVTVTGHASRDSLEWEAIRESPARDVGEALASMPGVWSLRKGGIGNDISVRGLQARDLSVLIDGERIYGACPNRMDPTTFHVDFAEVERVEVGKGPFDVRNQGSLGGTVNVVTKDADPGWNVSPNLSAGSWGYLNPSATVSYGGEKYSVLGGYSYREADPYRDGDGDRFTEGAGYLDDAIDSAAYRIGTGWLKGGFVPAPGHRIDLSWTRQDADHVLYPYLLMDGVYDDADRLNLSWEGGPFGGEVESLSVQGYYTEVSHWMTDEHRTSSAGAPRGYSMGTKADSRTTGARFEARLEHWTAGLEAFSRFWETYTAMAGMGYAEQHSLPAVDGDFAGAYAEGRYDLGERWDILAGVRLDYARTDADEGKAPTDLYYAYHDTRSTSRSDTLPSGNVRFQYEGEKGWEFAAGIGHTTRIPEPSERYFALKRKGSDWVGDPELDPSRATGLDVAFSLRRRGAYFGASAFWSRVEDYVTVYDAPRVNAVPGVMNTTARSYANVDATLTGAEATATFPITDALHLTGEVSYVRGTHGSNGPEGIEDGDLAEIPPLRARVAFRYDTGDWWLELEGTFSSSQDKVDEALREEPTAGWGIANLRGGFTWKGFTFTGGVTNILDRDYAEHLSYQRDPFRSGHVVDEPGRAFFVNLAYDFHP